jgi:hypothetical protein
MEDASGEPFSPGIAAAFERVYEAQLAGRTFGINEVLIELYQGMPGVPQDRAATVIRDALAMLQWDIEPKVAAALIEQRQALLSIVSEEQVSRRVRRVAISLEPGGPSRDVDLPEAPSARMMAALRELDALDAQVPPEEVP